MATRRSSSSETIEKVEHAFDESDRALDENRDSDAENFARDGLELLDVARITHRPDLYSEGWTLLALVHQDRDEHEGVIECCSRALKIDPGNAYAKFLEGVARIELWDFGRADELLIEANVDPELNGDALYQRAALAEADGRFKDAEALYEAAASVDPEAFPAPVRISQEEARSLLEETIEFLPEEIRGALDNVEITVAEMPDRKEFAPEISPFLLGIYHGTALENKPHQRFPDRVIIFKRNMERIVGNREELLEELRLTLLHEIGHHLGFDEAKLESLGL